MITDESGNEVESFSFDPWGKRRTMSLTQLQAILGSWSGLTTYQKGNLTIPGITLTSPTTDKGFTGHRQLDNIGLIHMGGRVYDAEIGRFLSADPFVDDSTNLQSLNRYTYVNNNPLSYTDPSGYIKNPLKKLGKAIGKGLKAIGDGIKSALQKIGRLFAEVPGLSAVITVAGCVMVPAACVAIQQGMMALGAAITAANGGTIGQVFTGLAIGAIASGVPGGGGFWDAGVTGAIAKGLGDTVQASVGAMMFMGGVVAKAQGGKFIDGVKGAAVAMGISYGIGRIVDAVSDPSGDFRGEICDTNNNCRSMTAMESMEHQQWMANAVAMELPSIPQGLVDGVSGFGDAFGARSIRNVLGVDGGVNYDSGYYLGGEIAGTIWAAGTGAGLGARGAAYLGKIGGGTKWGHWINHNRYLRFGPGRMPANGGLPAGPKVPRMSLGPQRSGVNNPHLDLRVRPLD